MITVAVASPVRERCVLLAARGFALSSGKWTCCMNRVNLLVGALIRW